MNLASSFAEINWFSVIVATIAAFVIGGLWYSPVLFGKRWQKEVNVTDEKMKQASMPMIFGLSFVMNFISAVVLELFIGRQGNLAMGLIAGLLVGTGWIATSLAVNYLFARRSLQLFLIDAFYFIVYFAVMGVILGAW